ncbi:hypothetical protein ACB092_01G164600 [Castanea dentata]
MEYTKLNVNDQDEDGNGWNALSVTNNVPTLGGTTIDWSKWKLNYEIIVIIALTLLTSSQSVLIVWSKRNGKYNYSITTSNLIVETLKCGLFLLALARIWRSEGFTEDNRLGTTLEELIHVAAPGYQILKNLNVISTSVLYRIILKDLDVFQTPVQGWVMAIVMALLSGLAGVYTEAIIKKRPSRNTNVQNFFLYDFGMLFSTVAIVTQDFDAMILMILNQALRLVEMLLLCNGLAVSMVMKYADNIVKVYSTSVAMLFKAFVSYFLFGFHLALALTFGTV